MILKPIQAATATPNANSSVTQTVTSFTFINPIKLDKSNYTIWKSQILYSVRANGFEGFLDDTKCCPDQFPGTAPNAQENSNQVQVSTETQENPAFST